MAIRFIRDTLAQEAGSGEGFKAGDIPNGMPTASERRWVHRGAAEWYAPEAVTPKPKPQAKKKASAKAKAKP